MFSPQRHINQADILENPARRFDREPLQMDPEIRTVPAAESPHESASRIRSRDPYLATWLRH
jgi:hypothetical protein